VIGEFGEQAICACETDCLQPNTGPPVLEASGCHEFFASTHLDTRQRLRMNSCRLIEPIKHAVNSSEE
jgi:hypothetical protein